MAVERANREPIEVVTGTAKVYRPTKSPMLLTLVAEVRDVFERFVK